MDALLTLNRLAVHYIDKKAGRIEIAQAQQEISTLHPLVVEFLLRLVAEVWSAEDSGRTNSARFARLDSSLQIAEAEIDRIQTAEDQTYPASVILAQHLYAKSPSNASPGLLAVLRLVRSLDGAIFVALLKIEVKSEKFIRLGGTALTQLTVEDIENLLLEKIQKGALCPHPQKPHYDLKVVDKQASYKETAQYFSRGFLGCLSKRADEHQIKHLIPELERYARQANLPFANQKIPEVLLALQEQNRDITTPLVASVARQVQIFGTRFDPTDFAAYIDQKSLTGPLDIPKEFFAKKGTGEKNLPRELTIRFTDPRYRGVLISGSP